MPASVKADPILRKKWYAEMTGSGVVECELPLEVIVPTEAAYMLVRVQRCPTQNLALRACMAAGASDTAAPARSSGAPMGLSCLTSSLC